VDAILSRNKDLHYYQGFHDICLVLLLVLGDKYGFVAAERVSRFYLRLDFTLFTLGLLSRPPTPHVVRDAMSPTLEPVISILNMVYPLVGQVDEELFRFFWEVESNPFFALPWVITWFSHDLDNQQVVERIFDFLLSSHPLMPLYLTASVRLLSSFPTLHIFFSLVFLVACRW